MAGQQQSRRHHHPFVGAQQALAQLGGQFASGIQHIQHNVGREVEHLRAHAAGLAQQVQAALAHNLQAAGAQAAPLLASITARAAAAGGGQSAGPTPAQPRAGKAVPVFELAYNPEEIKFRLAAVPVYAVVNTRNEFVLVTGDDGQQQLGLFFFTEDDARAYVGTLKEHNPKLARQAKVLASSLDRVYEFAISPRETAGLEGVTFRFMPDGRQVEAALALYRAAGVPAGGFTGVPLFQAEGLTVKSESTRYTPLFFSKEDLDVALGTAFLSKDSAEQAETRAKADRARAELDAANAELKAASEKERRGAQRKSDQAAARLSKYEQRLAEVTAKKKAPRVDVGSLEEVIAKMEADEKGEWGDVMFVPSGAIAAKAAAAAAPADAQAKKKKK